MPLALLAHPTGVGGSPAAPERIETLASHCEVVFICVSKDGDLMQIVDAIAPGLRAGQLVVDTSTVGPGTAREVGARLAQNDVEFADAPVSGGVEGAKNGRLSVMVGANDATFERILPLLKPFAAEVRHMGGIGNGQAAKAVNQVLVGGIAEAVCEGLALAEHLGLPTEPLQQVLSSGAAGNWFLSHRGRTMRNSEFGAGFKQSLLLKDLQICLELAQDLDISVPVVERALEDYRRLVEAGYGDEDISGLIRLKRDGTLGDVNKRRS